MADDPMLDRTVSNGDDALDADLAERFSSLDSLTPPDTWARTTGASTTSSGFFGDRRSALLVAAAAVAVAAGVASLQFGSSPTTSVDAANTPAANAPADTGPDDARPDNAGPDDSTLEPEGRPPVNLKQSTAGGATIADLRLDDGSRFRISLPERLGTDLRLIESDVLDPNGAEPVRLSGADVDIEIDFGFCRDEDGMTINAQGSAVSRNGDVVRVCRPDEVLSTTVTSSVEIGDDDLDAFDVRPIAVAGAYATALTAVWPDLANCGNCARWGPMILPNENIVVHRTGATSVTAVRFDTLVPVWSTDTGGFDTYLHGGPDAVYLEVTGGPLLKLDPSTGIEDWRIERDPDERDLGLDVIGPEAAVIRTSFSTEGDDRAPLLRRIDLAAGAIDWTRSGREGTRWASAATVEVNGLVVLADTAHGAATTVAAADTPPSLVWAFDLEDGTPAWTSNLTTDTAVFESNDLTVLAFEFGLALIARSVDGDIHRIDPATGTILWQVTGLRAQLNGTDVAEEGRLAIDLATPSGRRLIDPETGDQLTPIRDQVPPVCPVTVPSTSFEPPEPWPATPSTEGSVWYGTEDLWTVLDPTGHVPRKSVWWSADFPGGAVEERPELAVTYRRIGTADDPVVFASPGTNAFTAEDGDFMINGIEPDEIGCWLATATYKGATLSYIYEVG